MPDLTASIGTEDADSTLGSHTVISSLNTFTFASNDLGDDLKAVQSVAVEQGKFLILHIVNWYIKLLYNCAIISVSKLIVSVITSLCYFGYLYDDEAILMLLNYFQCVWWCYCR